MEGLVNTVCWTIKSLLASWHTTAIILLFGNTLVFVAQSCPTLCDPTDCSPPGSSVNGILKEKILEWVALSFSRGSSSRGMNLSLLHCRQILHHLSHQGSPISHSVQFSSVAQLCPTFRPHESKHARPPCPSPTPGVHPDSCPSNQ